MIRKCDVCKKWCFKRNGWMTTVGKFVCFRCRIEVLSHAFVEEMKIRQSGLEEQNKSMDEMLDILYKLRENTEKLEKELAERKGD